MAWEIRRGLEGMRRVVRENRIPGVHGVLIDLLDVMDSLHLAVEARFLPDDLGPPTQHTACAAQGHEALESCLHADQSAPRQELHLAVDARSHLASLA